jgi:hypothetical protein
MANLDQLGGVIGEVLGNIRPFADSWDIPGLQVTGEVLRSSHPNWRQHELDLAAARPEFLKRQELVNEAMLNPIAPPGFREKKKLSPAQAHMRLVEKTAKLNTNLMIDIFNLRERKKGISSILCKSLRVNGDTTVTMGGREHDLTTSAGRESLLDHETWEFEQDGEVVEQTIPVYKLGPDGEKLLDDSGEPVLQDCGGWNLGDAIAWLIEAEADKTELFVRARKADALEVSGAPLTGPSGSGLESPSNSDG